MESTVDDLTINGARLWHEQHGPAGAPALAILHGGPGVGDCRDQVRDYGALADEFRLLFYDARGSGRSADVPPYTHEQWVADLDELTRQARHRDVRPARPLVRRHRAPRSTRSSTPSGSGS